MSMINAIRLIVIFMILTCSQIGQQAHAQTKWKVSDVPDPKNSPGWNYVSNPDGVLSEGAVEAINGYLNQLEEATADQVAVVVLQSIGKQVPRDFAMELLRHWGVGQKGKNNGVMVLLVMDQRRMEFEVGYGVEGKLTDLVAKQIQERYMVPLMKRGDYDGAVINGIKQVVNILHPGQTLPEESDSGPSVTVPDQPYTVAPSEPYRNAYSETPVQRSWFDKNGFWGIGLFLFLGVFFITGLLNYIKGKRAHDFYFTSRSVLFTLLQFVCCFFLLPYFLFWLIPVKLNFWVFLIFAYAFTVIYLCFVTVAVWLKYNRALKSGATADILHHYARQIDINSNHKMLRTLFPFPLAVVAPTIKGYISKYKDAVILSSKGREMRLIDEKLDDLFLNEAQLTEERIRSKDYDVWADSEGEEHIVHPLKLKSAYRPCPACTHLTYKMVSDITLSAATYSSSGSGLRTYRCAYCKHEKLDYYTIPKKESSSSSSSSSSSGGGSSWGGGSSGGGGAGSSW